MAITSRVEYFEDGAWHHHADIPDNPNVCVAEVVGLVEARTLWRRGVAGVKVSVIVESVVLERMR